jgi:hypothetical protein
MTEGDRIKEILIALPTDRRLFRINSGMGWAGEVLKKTDSTVILKNARPLHAAPAGWPDLCGWTTIKITPDMVGRELAVFTAVEVKVTGGLNKAQRAYRAIIEAMGGIFEVVR